jgi:hypothetical protein
MVGGDRLHCGTEQRFSPERMVGDYVRAYRAALGPAAQCHYSGRVFFG